MPDSLAAPLVLLVDDDPNNLAVLEAMLSDLDLRLVRAMTGARALEFAATGGELALVLLDVFMPGIDGFETARRLRQLPEGKTVPIVFVTAQGKANQELFEGYSSGAVDYLVKPLEPVILRAKVAVFLQLYRQRQALVRAQAAAARAKIQAQFHGLLEALGDACVVVSAGEVLYVNPAAERLFGRSSAEMTASDFRLSEHCAQGEGSVAQVIRRPDGTSRCGETQTAETEWQDRPATVITIRDVTKRVALESALRSSQALLHKAQRLEALGRLAGGVANDYNNMLNVILGHAEIALAKLDPANPACGNLETIRVAGDRSAELTRALLAFAGQLPLQPRTVNVNKVVRETERLMLRTLGEDIHVVLVRAPEEVFSEVDPVSLQQALVNLCLNARNAMQDGGRLTIEVAPCDLDEAQGAEPRRSSTGRYVLLAVSDEGSGMSPEALEHVFEPFYSAQAEGGAPGLELASVRGFVEQSGGQVVATSEVGVGSTFRIYLPRVEGGSPTRPDA